MSTGATVYCLRCKKFFWPPVWAYRKIERNDVFLYTLLKAFFQKQNVPTEEFVRLERTKEINVVWK